MARVFNNRILLFIIAVLLISNIGMLLFWYKITRDHDRPRGDMGRSPMSSFLEDKIGFDKRQMEVFDSLKKDHRQKLKPLFDDMKNAKTGFYRLVNVNGVPDSLIKSEASKIGLKQQALDLQTFENFRQLRNLCTDQQRPLYDSLIPGVISDMWFPSRRGRPMGDSSKPSRP